MCTPVYADVYTTLVKSAQIKVTTTQIDFDEKNMSVHIIQFVHRFLTPNSYVLMKVTATYLNIFDVLPGSDFVFEFPLN